MSCFPCISRITSRSVRDLRVFSVGLMIKSGARSCRITDQRLGCHHAVLLGRQCSQTSGGVWHRARLQHRSEEAAWGLLFLQDTHVSQFPRHSPHCFKPLYKRSSRRSLSYSFTHFDRSFLVLVRVSSVCSFVSRCSFVVSMMLTASCFNCELHGCRSFLSFRGWLCLLETDRVGKQTPAASELQLRDVTWSDESFSGCASSSAIKTRVPVGVCR